MNKGNKMRSNFFSFLLIMISLIAILLLSGNTVLSSSENESYLQGGPLILRTDKKSYDQGELVTFELENRANKTLIFTGSDFGLKITSGDKGIVFHNPTGEVNYLSPETIRIIKWKIPDSQLEPGSYTANMSSTGILQPEEPGSGNFSATIRFNITDKITNSSLSPYKSFTGFTNYEDAPTGVRILYPINWTVDHTITKIDDINSSVISFRNLNPLVSLGLIVNQLHANTTLDEYTSTKVDEIIKRNNTAITINGFDGFKIIESVPVTIANSIPAHKIVYECPCFPDFTILKRMEVEPLKMVGHMKLHTRHFLINTLKA